MTSRRWKIETHASEKRSSHGGTRRQILGIATVAIAGGLGALTDLTAASARKRGQKKQRRPRKKRTPPVNQSPAPPPPPPDGPPPSQLAYECPGPEENQARFLGEDRVAQTFLASRGGALRQLQVAIHKYPETRGDYVLQLVAVVEGKGYPSPSPLDVLAAVTIPDAVVPDGNAVLTGAFSGPILEAGRQYAAVVSRPRSESLATRIREGAVCNGELYRAREGDDFAFVKGATLIVSVLVD
jgi:hypothetical protein